MKTETQIRLKKVQLFGAITLLALSVLFLFQDSGITGHFSADFRSQVLNLEISQSQKFLMSTNSDENIHMPSIRTSQPPFWRRRGRSRCLPGGDRPSSGDADGRSDRRGEC
jgi:hypothetical protein